MVELNPSKSVENLTEVDFQKVHLDDDNNPAPLSVSRQLVLDVCEPFIVLKTVSSQLDYSFQMFQFGTFEYEDNLFVFGCEENQYQYSLEHSENNIPLLIARATNYGEDIEQLTLASVGTFSSDELAVISDAIHYTLDAQRVSARYLIGCRA